ncbi:MAG: ARMT1-like domain-containing protein [bacterium]
MKSLPECKICLARQTYDCAKLISNDPKVQEDIISKVLPIIDSLDISNISPPEATALVHAKIREITGADDVYKPLKVEYNKLALSLYPELKEMVAESEDRFEAALKIAMAGNVIDFGAHSAFDVEATLDEVMADSEISGSPQDLEKQIGRAKKVLYIGDNAGEIVFDKVFIEEIAAEGKEVVYAVKSSPALNDVLMEDAEFCGLTEIVKVIESGSGNAGTMYEDTTEAFKKIYHEADVVIAKGQGNLETLRDPKGLKDIFYLLKVKCPYLADKLGLVMGKVTVLYSRAGERP